MPFAFQSSCSGQTSRVASPCSNRRTLSWGTDVLSWTPGKAHASKRRRTSATSSKLDVRGRLRCACNAASSAPPSEAATESPIPSRPPAARELFPTRVSVAPSGFRQWRRAPLQPRDRSLEVGPGFGINSEVFLGYPQPHKHHSKPKSKAGLGPDRNFLLSPKSFSLVQEAHFHAVPPTIFSPAAAVN